MTFEEKSGHGYLAKWNASLKLYEIYDDGQHVVNYDPSNDRFVILQIAETVLGRIIDLVKLCIYHAKEYKE